MAKPPQPSRASIALAKLGAVTDPNENVPRRASISDPNALCNHVELPEELKARMFDSNPHVQEEAVVEAFGLFDVDESGEIDTVELNGILKTLGLHVSKDVSQAILAEIDKDESGSIDADEFTEFFRQIKNVEDLQKTAQAAEAKKSTLSVMSGVYMFFTLITIFILLIFSEDTKDPMLTLGLYIAVAAFVGGIFKMLCWPIFILKFRPAEKFEKLKQWYQKRKEKDMWADRTKKNAEMDPENEERFQPGPGASGSYRNRDPVGDPTLTAQKSSLRAIADVGGSKASSNQLALAVPRKPALRRPSKESQDEGPGFIYEEEDPNEIKPLYYPWQYDSYLDLQARDEAHREADKAAEEAEAIEGGVARHYRAAPATHVCMLHNKAKLPAPVVAPWGDQRRFRKPKK